jgi:hypothetical protein
VFELVASSFFTEMEHAEKAIDRTNRNTDCDVFIGEGLFFNRS